MNAINVRINTDTPKGLKLIHEIEKQKKIVTIDYPNPTEYNDFTNTVTVDQAFDNLMEKVNAHYGTKYKLK
jgi:hypothetical protein